MIISQQHRFLYFVVPKSASGTLRQSLSPFVDIGWPISQYIQHQTIDQFLASNYGHLFNEYFKFTFVRNPYDRLYSGFLQDHFAAAQSPRWAAAKQSILHDVGMDFSRYFSEYVMHADLLDDWRWICFTPMVAFSHHHGSPAMDFVGRAESFDEDLRELGRRLGLEIAKSSDVNVRTGLCSKTPKYLDRLDRATVSAINQRYREDFEAFGYEVLDPAGFPLNVETCLYP